MQIMKSLNVVLVLALMGVSLSACDLFEQRDRSYNDDPKLEFAPLTETVDEGAGTVTTNIQLIGPQRDAALPVTFSVDDSSTAVEGTHYTLSSTNASIPADASGTEISIEVLDNAADDGETNYELFLSLQDSEGVEAAENLKTFTLTIRGTEED